jgi:hypothetical protein
MGRTLGFVGVRASNYIARISRLRPTISSPFPITTPVSVMAAQTALRSPVALVISPVQHFRTTSPRYIVSSRGHSRRDTKSEITSVDSP